MTTLQPTLDYDSNALTQGALPTFRKSKKLLATILASGVLAGVVMVGGRHYSNFIKEELIAGAREQNVYLTLDDFELDFLGIRAEKGLATISLPSSSFFEIEASNITVSPSFWSLFSNGLGFQVNADAYGGTIEGNGHEKDSLLLVEAAIKDLGFWQHPFFRSLGVASGTINAEKLEFTLQDDQLSTLSTVVKLTNLSVPEKTTIPASLTGGFPVTVPALKTGNGTLSVTLEQRSLTITNMELNTSWGDVKGSVNFQRTSNGRISSRAGGQLQVKLTPAGSALVGPFLPLVSNNAISSDSREFSVEFDPKRGLPRFYKK